MTKWLAKIAEHSEAGWIAAVALAVLNAVIWIDSKLYDRYRSRLEDSIDWNDELTEKVQKLEDRIDERDERIEELEDRADTAEAHAEWCEQTLMEVLAENPDIEKPEIDIHG